MNKLIVLSGNSPRNQVWGEAAVAHFVGWFDDVYMQYYDHWKVGAKDMNFEQELEKLAEATKNSSIEYYFIAKSIGSLLTLMAVKQGFVKPKKCVFFGMPLEMADEEIFREDWSPLSTFTVPAIAFHNDEDPISYPYTKDALIKHNPTTTLFTLIGNNHDYLDFADYDIVIKDFINE